MWKFPRPLIKRDDSFFTFFVIKQDSIDLNNILEGKNSQSFLFCKLNTQSMKDMKKNTTTIGNKIEREPNKKKKV
jgi:hypothetical protein